MTIEELSANVTASMERIAALEKQIANPFTPAAFDRKGAAAYLGIGTSMLDKLRTLGLIRECRACRFSREELDRYLRENTKDKFQNHSPATAADRLTAPTSQGIKRAGANTSRRGSRTAEPGKI